MYKNTVFAKAFGASLGIMLLVAAVGVYGGLAFAVPVSGTGSYTLQADQIDAENAIVYPSVGKQALVVEFTGSQIEGLKITKQVSTPAGDAKVVITADGTVTTKSLVLRAQKVHAKNSDLTGLVINANNENVKGFDVSTGANSNAGQTVDVSTDGSKAGLHLENFTIDTKYIVTNNIGIPGLSVEIKMGG